MLLSCSDAELRKEIPKSRYSIMVLGIAQDAGYPQANCHKECCKKVWNNIQLRKMVCSLAVLDHEAKDYWIIDATPDLKDQIKMVQNHLGVSTLPKGIFLTHAHVGHYIGLMHLGREIIGSKGIPVYVMPRMKAFLETNGPWSQLVSLNNISLIELENEVETKLSKDLSINPVLVPHRDEYSETVGYEIAGPNKAALFIPDINKWEIWEKDITTYISKIDYAFLDGSFYENGEIPGRDMSEIPHPFLVESMNILKKLDTKEKSKVYFIHFNHTNPVLDIGSEAYKEVIEKGFNISTEGGLINL